MSVRLTTASLVVSLWSGVALSGCSAPSTSSATNAGPVGQALSLAAEQSGVPRDLLVAIAVEERGLRLAPHRTSSADDHVPVAGYLELRHGKRDTLTLGAELRGTAPTEIIEDTILGTQAGADVLAQLGRETGATSDLSSWGPALEELSGLKGAPRAKYAESVLTRLRDGGRFPAWAGEVVQLDAHPDVQPGAAPAPAATTPQFPGAIWFETSCDDKCDTTRTSSTIDQIVIHDTEGDWTASVATLQSDPAKSVHYIVDADGSRVGQFLDESVDAWHAGNSYVNNRSIGIEHVGQTDDPDGYADSLYATSAQLVASIRTRHDIPADRQHIYGHYQVPNGTIISEEAAPCSDPLLSCEGDDSYGGANNHRDPGPAWQWCQYMQRLGGSCDCNDTYAHFNCTTDRTQAVRCVNGQVEIVTCASACVTEPTGQDDLCDPAPDGGSASAPSDGGVAVASPVVPSQPVTTTGTPSTPTKSSEAPHAGCNVAGTSAVGDVSIIALMLLGLALRRRRVEAPSRVPRS